jgi:aspartate aminotransferase
MYRRRGDLLLDVLNATPGFTCARPQGAFYVYAGVAGCLGRVSAGGRRLESDTDVAEALLEEQHVATVPGPAFGASPYLRLSYAAAEATLAEACRRIRAFATGLR